MTHCWLYIKIQWTYCSETDTPEKFPMGTRPRHKGHGMSHIIRVTQRVNFVLSTTVLLCGGTSVNENLLQGPDLTNTLLDVLLRFRQGKVAFTGDIKSMFFQVKVDPRDCDSLRFLWWPSNDLSKPAADYQMLVHLFGATSSPACASYALKSR